MVLKGVLYMTRLEDLLYSLTTVLIRYHDYQKNVVKEASDGSDHLEAREQSRLFAKFIIQDTQNNFKKKLNDLIINSTGNGYSQRKHFLNYLSTELVFLKNLIDNNNPIGDLRLEEYKDRISMFFKNIRTLLSIEKSKTGPIKLQDIDDEGYVKRTPEPDNKIIHKTIALSGLINDDYFGGGYYCRSAELLDQEVLTRAHMGIYFDGSLHIPTCSDEAIAQFVSDLFTEHLNVLLIAQLLPENACQKEIIKKLEETSAEQVACLYQATNEVVSLKSTIDQQQETIKKLVEEVVSLKEKLNNAVSGTFPSVLSTAHILGIHGGLWKFGTSSRIINDTEAPEKSSSSDSPKQLL